MPSNPDGIGGLARTRRGQLIRPELLASGFTDEQVERYVEVGLLQRVQAGILLAGTMPPSWDDKMLAAVLAAGEAALASHLSAGRLYGLDGIKTATIEITVPYTHGPTPDGVIVHRTRRPRKANIINGIPVTTVEQTLLDIGTRVPMTILLKALASALRRRLTTIVALKVFLKESTGRGTPGVKKLRAAIARYDDGSPAPGSDGEVAFFEYLDHHGIELPKRQFELTLLNGQKIYLDFAWDERDKAIEYDGLESRADVESHDHELERQNEIWDLGWQLRRYSPKALRDRPKETYRKIVRFLDGP